MSADGELVRIDDTSLFVVERGSGYPVIVLHGGPGLDHHEFADYLDPLTDEFRLLLVDQRANGRSERPPESTWTLERMAQDVIMLARAMHLDRYAVLGHSYGAFVALQNAVDYPGMAAQTIVSGGIPSMKFLAAVEANLNAFEPVALREQVIASWARGAGGDDGRGLRAADGRAVPVPLRGSARSAHRRLPGAHVGTRSTRRTCSACSRRTATAGSRWRTGSARSRSRSWS